MFIFRSHTKDDTKPIINLNINTFFLNATILHSIHHHKIQPALYRCILNPTVKNIEWIHLQLADVPIYIG